MFNLISDSRSRLRPIDVPMLASNPGPKQSSKVLGAGQRRRATFIVLDSLEKERRRLIHIRVLQDNVMHGDGVVDVQRLVLVAGEIR